jgi:hypothetical protein
VHCAGSSADQVKLLQRSGMAEPGSAGSSGSGQHGFGSAQQAGAGSNAWTDRRRWETDRTPGVPGWCFGGGGGCGGDWVVIMFGGFRA